MQPISPVCLRKELVANPKEFRKQRLGFLEAAGIPHARWVLGPNAGDSQLVDHQGSNSQSQLRLQLFGILAAAVGKRELGKQWRRSR